MNKVVFVTGATRGIGKQIALSFAKKDIAINYRTENEELQKTKQELEEYKVTCLCVQGDIANFEDCERMTKEIIDTFGKIDVLVNNHIDNAKKRC